MKKKMWVVLLSVLLSVCLAFAGCNIGKKPKPVDPEPDPIVPKEVTVTLNKTTASMTVGDALKLVATIEGAAAGTVATWTSTAPTIASVTDGNVTAVAPGTASIVAEVGNKAAACIITVTAKKVVGLSLDARLDTQYNQVSMATGSFYDIKPIISGAKPSEVEWTSSVPTVATVTSGVVSALTIGKTVITAKLGDITKSIEFNVYAGWSDGVHTLDYCTDKTGLKKDVTGEELATECWSAGTIVTRILMGGAHAEQGVTSDEQLRIGFAKQEEDVGVRFEFTTDSEPEKELFGYSPTNMDHNIMGVMDVTEGHGFSWAECVKDSTATKAGYEGDRLRIYNIDGLMDEPTELNIIGHQVYTVEYLFDNDINSARYIDTGKFFSFFSAIRDHFYIANVTTLINHDPSPRITVTPSEVNTLVDLETTLAVRYKNCVATDFTWAVTDPTIATYTDGVIKGIKEGSTTLTATFGSLVVTVPVTVAARTVTLSLNETTKTMYTDSTFTLVPTVQNAISTHIVEWTSSDTTVATVASDGIVTAGAAGSTTITATVKEGTAVKATATCAITIEDKAIITIADGNGSVYDGGTVAVGNTFNLRPTIQGGTVTDVAWSSSNDAIATVSAGIITGVSAGEATITGSLKGATVTFAITVYAGKGAHEIIYTNEGACTITDYTASQTKWAKDTYAYSIPVGVQRQDGTLGADTLRFGFAKNKGDVGVRFEFYLDKDFWTQDGFQPMGTNFMGQINPGFKWLECIKMSNAADAGEKPGYEGKHIKMYDADGAFIVTPTEDTFTAGKIFTMEIDYTGLKDGDSFGVFMATIQNVYVANVQVLTKA